MDRSAEGFWRGKTGFALLAAALVLTWSAGFVGLRLATTEASTFTVLFWRCLAAGLVLLPFALLHGPRMGARAIAEQSLFGVLTMFVYLGGFTEAISLGVPTGLVALIADLVPLAIAALSFPLLGERLDGRQWLGTFIGCAGVLIVSAPSLQAGSAPLHAYGLAVGGMLAFAVATVMQKRMVKTRLPIHQTLAIQCLAAALVFGLCNLAQGGIEVPVSGVFWFGIAWLVVFATFICYWIYYWCLRLWPAARVASVIYLSPPVTMIWAWAMFGEPLNATMAAGLAVTFAGVWLAAKG